MYKDQVKSKSPLGNATTEQAYEALKTRLRRRIQRVQRALNERAGVELPAVQVGKL
jgi:hypothetical protein